jgi:hypothetical protein
MDRAEWKNAPGPPFSPSTCLTPCLIGTSKSIRHISSRFFATAVTTNSAPRSAAFLSVVCSMRKPAP